MNLQLAAAREPWERPTPASPIEIAELQRLGYKVEDLGAEYGSSFEGRFRWINVRTGQFQDDEESYSEAAAWNRAKADWASACDLTIRVPA